MRHSNSLPSGFRVIDPSEKKVGRKLLRPKGYIAPEGNHIIELTDLDTELGFFCPEAMECSYTIPVGFINPPRKIADIIDGEPKLLILYKHRWKCKYCAKLANSKLVCQLGTLCNEPAVRTIFDGLKQGRTATDNFDQFIIEEIMSDPSKKNNAFSKFEVSASYVQKLVSDFLNHAQDSIESVLECEQLIFYPFEYGPEGKKQSCCFVLGYNKYVDRSLYNDKLKSCQTVLLQILDDYEASTITGFLLSQAKFHSYSEVIFCGLHPEVYKRICQTFEKENVAIILETIKEKVDNYFTEDTQLPDSISDEYVSLQDRIGGAIRLKRRLDIPLTNWWNDLPDNCRIVFQDLWSEITPCMQGLKTNHFLNSDNKNVIKIVKKLIAAFEKNHLSYKIMKYRMLFTIPAVRDKLFKDDTIGVLFHYPYAKLSGFYVDIPMLESILGNCLYQDASEDSSCAMNAELFYFEQQ